MGGTVLASICNNRKRACVNNCFFIQYYLRSPAIALLDSELTSDYLAERHSYGRQKIRQ